jgi:[CysO sulfur-carrier protein]-S-L-cysteine hydrolase
VKISQALYDELVTHAREDFPDECCGLVSTRDDEAVEVFRIENTAHTYLRYEMDSQEQLRAVMAIEDAGLDVGIIYHSHTRSEPYPSQTDINLASGWPDSLYIIIGVRRESPEAKVRAYTIRDGQVQEAPLTVV